MFFISAKMFYLAQAIFVTADLHGFDGDEIDCEYFLDYNPYELHDDFPFEIDFQVEFEIPNQDEDEDEN